jgi:mono/diheme cytochrome c family protein
VRGFINGIVFTVALALGAGFVAIQFGLIRAGADAKPDALERWAANTSLHATLRRATKQLQNPLEPSDANLIDGVHLYAANCAVCHGASDGKPSKLAQGFAVEAPMLATDGVEDDPVAVSYWKVKHGIRFTAMPSFSTTLSDEDDWKIAMFLSKMDHLPPAVEAEWKKVPSAARGS